MLGDIKCFGSTCPAVCPLPSMQGPFNMEVSTRLLLTQGISIQYE